MDKVDLRLRLDGDQADAAHLRGELVELSSAHEAENLIGEVCSEPLVREFGHGHFLSRLGRALCSPSSRQFVL